MRKWLGFAPVILFAANANCAYMIACERSRNFVLFVHNSFGCQTPMDSFVYRKSDLKFANGSAGFFFYEALSCQRTEAEILSAHPTVMSFMLVRNLFILPTLISSVSACSIRVGVFKGI